MLAIVKISRKDKKMRVEMKRFLVAFFVFSVCANLTVLSIAEEMLTWQDCVKEAAKNHPDLISAQESIKQSEASKKITTSTIFPQIDASASGSTTETAGKATDSYKYGVSGSQLLFDGFKTSNNINAASENIKAAQFSYKFTSSEVRLNLRTAFINLLKAQELLKITKEIYDIRRNNLMLITLRYESGLEHKGALLNAEANLAQSQYEISQANRSLEVAQRELTKEMGRTKFEPISVTRDFNVQDSALDKPDFEALVNNHPSLGKLIAQRNSASFSIKSAEANFYPSLSAQAGANKSSSRWPPEDDQWNAGLSVSVPIFEGGLRLAQVDQAKAVFNQAVANERSTKDALVVALEQMWADLQDAVDSVGVQQKFLQAAQERANIAEAQYSLGLIQFDNWTIIEDNLVSAKKSFLNAQVNALQAEANWLGAKGDTLEYAQK